VAHQHYKGTGQMHSFRGLLADGGQDRIRIEGATGEIAWRITKFQTIPETPGAASQESVVKVYREEQSTVDGSINFKDDELLAASFFSSTASTQYPQAVYVVFDNALFVRNLWITHSDVDGSLNCNYYIELEEVKVSAAGMAQLAVAAARRT
jgi:hypothetical protein